MTIQDVLRAHLETSGESMRGLSLRAGLGPKAVADILSGKSGCPTRPTLDALSAAMGQALPTPTLGRALTYAGLFRQMRAGAATEDEAKRVERRIWRLNWYLRNAGRVAETAEVDRRAVIDFFAENRPTTFGLTPGSYATYKSDILDTIDSATCVPRKRTVQDIAGPYRTVQDLVRGSDLPEDLKNSAGSFLTYLHDREIEPGDITTETLRADYDHRLASARTTEKASRKHVKRIAALLERLAADPVFATYGFTAPPHPFEDGRDKFGIADELIAPLLADFDARVAPWARGEMSATGMSREDFIARLDRDTAGADPKKDRLRQRRKGRKTESKTDRREKKLKEYGFLLPRDRWAESTLANRRAQVVAAAKALAAETGYVVETLEDLTDPEVAEEIADVLSEANDGEFPSSYVAGILKTLRKLAGGLLGRGIDDLEELSGLIRDYATDETAMSQRNLDRLRAFDEDRIDAFLNLSGAMLADINATVERRRRQKKRGTGPQSSRLDVYDRGLAQHVMLVIAHDILLKRAPRKGNVTGILLDWIRWRDGLATIVIPSGQVKCREEKDADIPIPLGAAQSQLLRTYIDKIRCKALAPGDEQNPHLFPSQDRGGTAPGRPYGDILGRLCREVHDRVGVRIHPHLYRHLLGWIWLREDPNRLPEVQKLLGHKNLETTLNFYVALDESLALSRWQEHLNERQTRHQGRTRVAA